MKNRSFIIATVLLFTCFASVFVNAESPESTTDESEVIAGGGTAASRVFVNPGTGKPGPPAEGMQPLGLSVAMKQRLSRSSRGLEARRLPDGTLLINLQGRFQNMSVATINHEGEAKGICSDSAGEIEHALINGAEQGNSKP